MIKNGQETLWILVGILGAVANLYGLAQPSPQLYYVIGSCLLLVTAIYFRLTYFIALELILISGHGAILLGIGPVLQVVLPILLCAQLLIYYVMSGQLGHIFRLIGISGIALLSIGFAYENQWIFLFGSMEVAIFAFYQVYRGRYIALLWAILNTIFMLLATYQLLL